MSRVTKYENSFWGKFDQRENLPQVQQCTNPDQLYKIIGDDTKQVQEIRFCTEDVLEVDFKNKEEAVTPATRQMSSWQLSRHVMQDSNCTVTFINFNRLVWTWRKKVRQPFSGYGSPVPQVGEDTATDPTKALVHACAQYQGMPEEQFGGATQRMEGNPLVEFDFLPVSEQLWTRRVQKTIYHTQLRQRRTPEDTDDMGVAIVSALEDGTITGPTCSSQCSRTYRTLFE